MENKYTENSRKRLTALIKKEVTRMMEQSLDFAHVACPPDNFKQLRSKILRAGNNCMRSLERDLDDFEVNYTRVTEEVIEFRN
jgi:hypothetical protein